MFERLFGTRSADPDLAARLPPGQYLTEKFPVLHYGSVPKADLSSWDFKVYGEVDNPLRLTWDEFRALPRKPVVTDIHCVTRWSKLDTHWEGVAIQTILELAQVRGANSSWATRSRATRQPAARVLTTTMSCSRTRSRARRSSRTTVPAAADRAQALLLEGPEVDPGAGVHDPRRAGLLERYGYSNGADPWQEERFSER